MTTTDKKPYIGSVLFAKETPLFARIKKSGRNQYLQIVENRREGSKVIQRVIATLGRMDQLTAKDGVEVLVRSLSRFSTKTLIVLSGKGDVRAQSTSIGRSLIFERLWHELGIKQVINELVAQRKYDG